MHMRTVHIPKITNKNQARYSTIPTYPCTLQRIPECLVFPISQVPIDVHHAFGQDARLAAYSAAKHLFLDFVEGGLGPAGNRRRHCVLIPPRVLAGPGNSENQGGDNCEDHNDDGRDPSRAVLQRSLFDVDLNSVWSVVQLGSSTSRERTRYGPIMFPTLYPTKMAPVAHAFLVPPAILDDARDSSSTYGAPKIGRR